MSDSDRSSRNGPVGEIAFVKQLNENLLDLSQQETFKRAIEQLSDEVPSSIITEDDCLKILKRPHSTAFVFASFEGKAFCHLKAFSCCLIGAPLLLSCLEKCLPLPKSKIPIYCDVMRGAIVCCTNVDRQKRDDLHNLVQLMGGEIKRDFEETCNVLVADAVGSQKYKMAVQLRIPILIPDWVEQAWKTAISGKIFDATAADFSSKFKCLPFRGLHITVSGLRAEERKNAEKDIQDNGGTFNGDLKMGDITHLITNFAEGAKYEAAVKWNIKIVKTQWLRDSILCGACMNESDYAVDKNYHSNNQKVSTPTSAGVLPRFSLLDPNCSIISRRDPNITEISNVHPSNTIFCVNETGAQMDSNKKNRKSAVGGGAGEEDPIWDSPSKFTDPNKTFHPQFELDEAFKCYIQNQDENNESPSLIVERQLALAVKSTEQAEQFLRSPPRHTIPSEDFEMIEEPQTSTFTPARTGPLVGVVICVGKKVSCNPTELHNTVRQLGGSHSWTFDKCCTHFIFDGRANDAEYRKAREDGKFIVHPLWLKACSEKNCRIDESSFPYTYTPEKGVLTSAKKFKPNTQKLSQHKPKTQLNDTPSRKTKSESITDPFKIDSTSLSSKSSTTRVANLFKSREENDDNNDDVTSSFVQEKKSDPRESVIKNICSVLSRSKTLSSITSDENEQASVTSVATPVESLQPKCDLSRQQSDSQGLQVGWEDPKQKQERAKIEPLLKPMLEPTQNIMGGVVPNCDNMSDDDDIQFINEEKETSKPPDSYRFLLTSSDEFKESCIRIINTLHGVYIDNRNFVPDCTHLIVGKPTRNEKLLVSIATGKWCVHPDYLIACQKANRFLPEDDFEWGSSGTEKFIANLPAMSQNLARCCRRWRLKVTRDKVKPYDGWKVVLLVERNLENGLKSLLEYGGAKLFKKETAAGQLTHAFISDKLSAHLTSPDVKRFKKGNVKCFKPEYLAAYLIQESINESEFSV